MKKLLLLIVLLMSLNIYGQDIHFSQPWMTPLLQNPALAGANYDMQASLNYKTQWASVTAPYQTYGVSIDRRLYDRNRGRRSKDGFWAVGLDVFSDKAGDSKMGTFQGNLSATYHIRLDYNSTLSTGLMGGYIQRSINYSGLQWMNQYDGKNYRPDLPSYEPMTSQNIGIPDLGAGVAYAYNKGESYMTGNDHQSVNIGVAVFHPHQPDYSFYKNSEKLHVKWVGHGNAVFGIEGTFWSLVPGFMYYRQGTQQEILAGGLVRYMLKEDSRFTGYIRGSAFSFGAYYRNKDAIVAHAFLEFGQYAIGASYDINTSDLNQASNGNGSFEISLRWVQWRWFYYKRA